MRFAKHTLITLACLGSISVGAYESPVFPADANGYGEYIHQVVSQDEGVYEVTCITGDTAEAVAFTPFPDDPAADGGNIMEIEVRGDSGHVVSIYRFRDLDGDGEFDRDTEVAVQAQMDDQGRVIGTAPVLRHNCTINNGNPPYDPADQNLFRFQYNWPEDIFPNPLYTGRFMRLFPLAYDISNNIDQTANLMGHHESICLVKIGNGYSTNEAGYDEFCLSETGDCDHAQCVSSTNVCCADNADDQPVFNNPRCIDDPYGPGCQMVACCRLTPDHPGCHGCGRGERYCPITGQCINPSLGETCGSTCNNNSVCEVGESCDCGDCGGKQDTCRDGLVCNHDTQACEGTEDPFTFVSSEMRRDLCSTEAPSALLQCGDEDCEYFQARDDIYSLDGARFFGVEDNIAGYFDAFADGPRVIGGAMTFGAIEVSPGGPLVPLFIKAPNGLISQRYVYWNTQDTRRPRSNGLRFERPNGTSIDPTSPDWVNTDVRVLVDCVDEVNGRDTPYCGCDIDDVYGFDTEFLSGDDNNALYSRTISHNQVVNFTVKDTAGNEGGTFEQLVDFIDREAPKVQATTASGEDLSAIDKGSLASTNIKIIMTDSDSQIEDYKVSVGDATVLIDNVDFGTCDDGGTIPHDTKGQHGDRKEVALNNVSTSKALFVCVRDGAGNITEKKILFGGSRLINYYQGPIQGFSFSGELGVRDVDGYEAKLIGRIDDQDVAINGNYHLLEGEGNRIACQNNAIEQNIDDVARGRLTPHTSTNVIDDLTSTRFNNKIIGSNERNSDGVVYYEFDSTGADVDGNQGHVVEISGTPNTYANWNNPTQGSYSREDSHNFGLVGIQGLRTVIIEGGNLYINADMYYEDPQSMAVFVVKRGIPSIQGHSEGGNVYIDKDVTNVNGLFFVDGAIMNAERTSTGNLQVLNSYNEDDVEKLRRQLLIYGSLASSNTRGGSLKKDSRNDGKVSYRLADYSNANGHCPFGTDDYNSVVGSGFENCSVEDAAKYDLETFRTFNLGYSDKPYRLDTSSAPQCDGRTCRCYDDSKSERTPLGGVGTSSVIPGFFNSTTYALSGKRECFYSDPAVDRLETTSQSYATYIKFDTRELKYDFPILGAKDCR